MYIRVVYITKLYSKGLFVYVGIWGTKPAEIGGARDPDPVPIRSRQPDRRQTRQARSARLIYSDRKPDPRQIPPRSRPILAHDIPMIHNYRINTRLSYRYITM